MRRFGLIALLAVLLCGCEGTSWNSPVPVYPVRVEINYITEFVDFLPTNWGVYVTVTEQGYYKNGKFVKLCTVNDAWGYGGVVAYVSMGGIVAFDLACPNCAAHGHCRRCAVNGMYAVCPECGEEYELGSGLGIPTKGLTKDKMRELNVTPDGDKYKISQK